MKDFKKWISAAGIRALKTFAQTAASLITVGAIISDIDWRVVLSTAAVAAIYSLLTSIAGLPEVRLEEEVEKAIASQDRYYN